MSTVRSITDYIFRRVLDHSGRKDAERLSRLFEGLKDYDSFLALSVPDLREAYEIYLREVSTADMAVSLETSRFLYAMSKLKRASRILDLGSGFSSYAFGLYSLNVEPHAHVYSVDDDEKWLNKTRDFLIGRHIPNNHLMDWNSFVKSPPSTFDLIFHDLGNMNLRTESLPFIISLLDKSGVLILDDMHKKGRYLLEGYRTAAIREVKKAGLSLFSARQYTSDRHGRFCELAIQMEP